MSRVIMMVHVLLTTALAIKGEDTAISKLALSAVHWTSPHNLAFSLLLFLLFSLLFYLLNPILSHLFLLFSLFLSFFLFYSLSISLFHLISFSLFHSLSFSFSLLSFSTPLLFSSLFLLCTLFSSFSSSLLLSVSSSLLFFFSSYSAPSYSRHTSFYCFQIFISSTPSPIHPSTIPSTPLHSHQHFHALIWLRSATSLILIYINSNLIVPALFPPSQHFMSIWCLSD